jgi:hypothetical protein
LGNFSVAELLVVSQEGRFSMEFVAFSTKINHFIENFNISIKISCVALLPTHWEYGYVVQIL